MFYYINKTVYLPSYVLLCQQNRIVINLFFIIATFMRKFLQVCVAMHNKRFSALIED